ncbi:MAG: type II toxin-antitoxin system VapC family toxin [Gammaproteobacteria bacterium]|nr:type II toxin-antitoxin system VapC family toxin [Gammaproteobacteria bacterium]
MKALDTNVIIRFLVQDDEAQSKVVFKLLKSSEERKECFFIPILVVLETIWVLESAYDVERSDIIKSISDLILMPVFEFEKQSAIRDFLISSENTTHDLADILIAHSAHNSACVTTLTFDKNASKFKLFARLDINMS